MKNPLYNIASFFANKTEAAVANKSQKQEGRPLVIKKH